MEIDRTRMSFVTLNTPCSVGIKQISMDENIFCRTAIQPHKCEHIRTKSTEVRNDIRCSAIESTKTRKSFIKYKKDIDVYVSTRVLKPERIRMVHIIPLQDIWKRRKKKPVSEGICACRKWMVRQNKRCVKKKRETMDGWRWMGSVSNLLTSGLWEGQ